ncbi:hypothetical protein DFZ19_21685 [Escherichia coli]|uniref:Uncharacterized protein n=1 Tax=Escherichia coli TaxID=562 RepID=A0A8S7C0Q6_ECOLX|nr:hypothetical protein [Escherichia coli]EEY8272138.1 hypothetical protein [Escherichia coli]EEY8315227.1 hypothetical protein [Escherichia coli]EEY8670555.1 hypothetical protein [Escherichia coli]EEY8745047.1 hypothetical protein [Escherichia coli]
MLTSFPLNAGVAELFAENTVRCLDGGNLVFSLFSSSFFDEKTQVLAQDKANTLKCKALKFCEGMIIDACCVCEPLIAR